MAKSDKALSALVKEIEKIYGDNLVMVATTFERAFKNASERRINVILQKVEGGEFLKLSELITDDSDFVLGLFLSLDEAENMDPSVLVPLFTDCRVLYGSKEGLPKIARSDVRACAVSLLSQTLLSLRELALYADLEYAAENMHALYNNAAYAAAYASYLGSGRFIAEFSQLKNVVSDRDYVIFDIAENWDRLKNDRMNNPEDAIIFLEQYCRELLFKISA